MGTQLMYHFILVLNQERTPSEILHYLAEVPSNNSMDCEWHIARNGIVHSQVVSDPGQADFVLAHGTEVLGQGDGSEPVAVSIADMEALLQQCAAVTGRQVPMIVANPDLVTVDGAQLRVMPGSLARFYQSIGGEVSAF